MHEVMNEWYNVQVKSLCTRARLVKMQSTRTYFELKTGMNIGKTTWFPYAYKVQLNETCTSRNIHEDWKIFH